jgi:hypothetical protein
MLKRKINNPQTLTWEEFINKLQIINKITITQYKIPSSV